MVVVPVLVAMIAVMVKRLPLLLLLRHVATKNTDAALCTNAAAAATATATTGDDTTNDYCYMRLHAFGFCSSFLLSPILLCLHLLPVLHTTATAASAIFHNTAMSLRPCPRQR